MKILYIDCGMGAAGDMMTGALLELLPEEEQEDMLEKLRNAGLSGVDIRREKMTKCGILGTHIKVTVNGIGEEQEEELHHHDHEHDHHHHHQHMHMSDIRQIVEGLNISDEIKKDVLTVYGMIAEAESHVNGVETAEVHFHEVGMKDAIMDVMAACMLMRHISPDRIMSSPVHVGSGQVKCAHGIMPVPAPATAFILKEIPVYSAGIDGELCTPTGAALLKFFVQEYADMPAMATRRIGYGMGSRDFPRANCMRAFLGERVLQSAGTDRVVELSCNMDDITGEELGFAMERLYELGAKEVYTIPVGMKKSRPGIMLNVLCEQKDREDIIRAIFRYTTSIGIRETEHKRYVLNREERVMETDYGNIKYKHSEGYGMFKNKYEYEDIARIARDNGSALNDLKIPSLQDRE